MKINTLQELEDLIQLVNKHSIDVLQVGDIIISKSKHTTTVQTVAEEEPTSEDDEDLLFWSTGSRNQN